MSRKTIMAMPVKYFWAMVVACAAGIVAGSFFDFNINVALANLALSIISKMHRSFSRSITFSWKLSLLSGIGNV